jgi:hypothetical protein
MTLAGEVQWPEPELDSINSETVLLLKSQEGWEVTGE